MSEDKVVRVKQKNKNSNSKKIIGSIISIIVVILLIVFLMSGAVNQRTLLTNFINWFVSFSEDSGEKANKIINENSLEDNENEIPLDINDNGIYFKGRAPESQKPVVDGIEDE